MQTIRRTVQSAGKIQHTIAEAYRQQVGLLTGEEIKKLRKQKEMTQTVAEYLLRPVVIAK